MDRWEGKVAVVTGASAGIGASTVELLANAGLRVVALARRLERLEELAAKLSGAKGTVYPKKCDLNTEEEILSVLDWADTELGGIDVLINNAGYAKYSKTADDTNDSFRSVLNVNLLAPAITAKRAIASMKRRNVPGTIINVNSVLGHVNMSGKYPSSLYASSKHGLTALTESLRQELAVEPDNKIRVASLSPGAVKTEFMDAAGFSAILPNLESMTGLESVDVANAVLYILGTPQNVLVSELTIRHTRENL